MNQQTRSDLLTTLKTAHQLETSGQISKAIETIKAYCKDREELSLVYKKELERLEKKRVARESKRINKAPLLTVVIPCYNCEKYLPHCLDSVISQSETNIEIIAVNDGSTDQTLKILEEYSRIDQRILIINNQQPSGSPGPPRNQAILQATGDYIGFVDSDDWIDKTYFEEMLQKARMQNSDIVITKGHRNHQSNRQIAPREYKSYYFHSSHKKPSFYHPSSMIWDKIYKRHLLSENSILLGTGKAAVDLIFIFKAYYYSKSIDVAETDGYHYRRETENSVTLNQRKKTTCDFEFHAFSDSFNWAKTEKVGESFIMYMKIKQLMSFSYTLKLIKIDHITSYFGKCALWIDKHYSTDFLEALAITKNAYLIDDLKILKNRDLKSFVTVHRPNDAWMLINSQKHLIPKTTITNDLATQSRIIFCPDWTYSNPYQRLFYNAISANKPISIFGLEPAEFLPENIKTLSGNNTILHLHWVHPFTSNDIAFGEFLETCRDCIINNNTKLIWTVHNLYPHECPDRGRELKLRKELAKICHKVIVHSFSAKDSVIKEYGIDKDLVAVIPHGKYKPEKWIKTLALSEKSGSSNPQDRILRLVLLGELRVYKNAEWMFEVIRGVNKHRNKITQINLEICGKPISRNQQEYFSEMGNKYAWFTFRPGRLSDSLLSEKIFASDFVMIPYEELLTSGMAINALSHAKPFIAPYSGELQELGGSSSKLLYNNDEDLKRLLCLLAEEKFTNGTLSNFSPESIKQQTRHLEWESIVKESDALKVFFGK